MPKASHATRTGAREAKRRRRAFWPAARLVVRAVAAGAPSRGLAPEHGGAVGEVLAGALGGQEVGEDEIVTLFSARGPEVVAVAEVADEMRREAVGDVVTFVANRNINYTNVCTFKCRFCAFSKGPLSLNLRGSPYLLELEEITRRVVEAEQEGATEVCLQGGIHPSFDGDYYLEVLKAVRAGIRAHPHPRLHRARGSRGGAPARASRLRLPRPFARRRPAHAAGHGGGDPRRRGTCRPVPGQGQHRAVARGPPHRPRRRAAVERHHHVRRRRAAPPLGPAPHPHPRAAKRDRGVHRVRAPALRSHGLADLSPAQVASRPDVPRSRSSCTRSGASPITAGSTTSRRAG